MFDTLEWDAGLFAGESNEDEFCYQTTIAALEDHPEEDVHVLPDGLEEIGPGVFLAAVLGSVDPGRLTGHDLVRYIQARERLVSHCQAGFYAGVGELAYATETYTTIREVHPDEFATDELQAALAKTRRSADYELGLALDLRDRLPQVWEAFHEGRVDLGRARVFTAELENLDSTLIPTVIDQTLPGAAELTTGELRARLKKLVVTTDPQTAETNYETGLEDRKTVTYPNPDHTATLSIQNISPLDANLAASHLNTLATALKRLPGETRSIDQIRTDVAIDLLQGKTPDNSDPATPQIIIQIQGSEPGRIPGYGPILPTSLTEPNQNPQTRTETIIQTIPETGPIQNGCHYTTSRQPTTTQIRHIQSQYPTCVFPGCRMPATQCDLDHRHQHSKGGKTTCQNLAPLCRHHHICKDQASWKLQRNPNNSHTWTSPLGHTYTTPKPSQPP